MHLTSIEHIKRTLFLLSSSFFSWLILSLYRRILTADNTNPDILFATEFMLIQMTASVAILFLFVPKASNCDTLYIVPSIFALPFQSVLRVEQASIRNVRNILCCFS